MQMVQIREIEELSLEALENVFIFSLHLKSKCLIQACVIIAEKELDGIPSFGNQTQAKFLLESIHHIIEENCQKEFIHILHYLEMINSLCLNITCQEKFCQCIIKIKQSFVLYSILENQSASNVCSLMKEFFPTDGGINCLPINYDLINKRTLSKLRRDILSFRRLVDKLLTDMEFREYYFFDEWSDDFGKSFHSELISDINNYLVNVECNLIAEKTDKIFLKWNKSHLLNNPAMLYFIKILTDNESQEVVECEILAFLKWMFPAFDETTVTFSTLHQLILPASLPKSFKKLLNKVEQPLLDNLPWKFKSLLDACLAIRKSQEVHQCEERPKRTRDTIKKCDTFSNHKTADNSERIALQSLYSNLKPQSNFMNRKRRKVLHDGIKDNSALTPKRQCIGSSSSPPTTTVPKELIVDLGKENILAQKTSGSALKKRFKDLGVRRWLDSPQCRTLLVSGSRFFSSGGKSESWTGVAIAQNSGISGEVRAVQFSDDEGSESDPLDETEETMSGLSWITASKPLRSTPKSRKLREKASCRSLSFHSESDGIVSESETEEFISPVQPCVQMLDSSCVPDLTWFLNGPETKPCTVQLQYLSDEISELYHVSGCKVNQDAYDVISNERKDVVFRNYSYS